MKRGVMQAPLGTTMPSGMIFVTIALEATTSILLELKEPQPLGPLQ